MDMTPNRTCIRLVERRMTFEESMVFLNKAPKWACVQTCTTSILMLNAFIYLEMAIGFPKLKLLVDVITTAM